MLEVVAQSGKKVMRLADDATEQDVLYIDGKPVSLEDAYNDKELKKKFNSQIKLQDDK